MRLPLAWLSEYVLPGMGTHELADALSATGTEVEGIDRFGIGIDGFEHLVVGKILTAEQHPDADRLKVTTVDVGDSEPAQIVCGAPNVAAGQTVAVARPGTVMPDGTKLKKAKLRGVESQGMIVSEKELGLGDDHSGILVFPDDVAVAGTLVAELFEVSTDVLTLELTPNRPDCLGVYGMAREVHAATGAPIKPAPWREIELPPVGEVDGVTIDVQVPELCPRFTAIVYDDVQIGPSPLWLKARLAAAGQRSINNVVDITNYAMLLTGQPLHAFDLDQIAGGTLVVRRAKDGEKITTLDDEVRTLDAEMVVIDDAEGPTSIAGVMGGSRSEVSDSTTRVLMEVASWIGPNINRTTWELALRTEASTRFAKGLAPEQTLDAQAIAQQLMIELAGASPRPVLIDVGGAGADPQVIRLRSARVSQLLGTDIPIQRQEAILRSLEFDVAPADDGLDVTVPAFRRLDVTREADLVEEVARIDGMDNLPATLPARRGASGRLSPAQKLRRRAEDTLVGRGLRGVMGWSFTNAGVFDRLRLPEDDPRRRAVALANPMSEDHALLRTNLVASLLDVAAHNTARGVADLRLFERGAIYYADANAANKLANEHDHLAIVLTGKLAPATWGDSAPATAGVFAAKGILEALATRLRVDLDVRAATQPFLHPGRSGEIVLGAETVVGWIGEIHPLVARAWEIDTTVAAFELDLGVVLDAAVDTALNEDYVDLTSFPALRQDLAVVVDSTVRAADLVATAKQAGGKLLADAGVFDVYEGEQVGEGKRSLAMHLEFRAPDRTLTDEDADGARQKIIAALTEKLGAVPRG
ncbi:MAG: phenylalanine--tRNA ligase subunit beta [Solirubrobacteraceae bacterium]|nr:phenylalanine--tRNA ligase subunit beta [Solirubrobacteraceae bacterium]